MRQTFLLVGFVVGVVFFMHVKVMQRAHAEASRQMLEASPELEEVLRMAYEDAARSDSVKANGTLANIDMEAIR